MTGRGPAPLALRWGALWRRLEADGSGAAEYDRIAARYAEPARHYHTLDHVAYCLREFDVERTTARRPDEVEAALWLHDVVYDPRAGDNEERSAEFAAGLLSGAGVDDRIGERVGDLIRHTTHAAPAPPEDSDAALVCDADLAILGAAPDEYGRYAAAIRAEYAWVPAPLFRRQRAAVLERIAARDRIYVTPGFRRRLEAAARRNLGAELEQLRR